jgi:hypothetical protein
MSPASAASADGAPANHAFDRAAYAILGTMVSLILLLTAVLITVSAPGPAPAGPAPTAQTSPPPHRA